MRFQILLKSYALASHFWYRFSRGRGIPFVNASLGLKFRFSPWPLLTLIWGGSPCCCWVWAGDQTPDWASTGTIRQEGEGWKCWLCTGPPLAGPWCGGRGMRRVLAPAWCLHCAWGVCFSVVFDWSHAVVCFHCPFHLLWLETAGFWGPCLFVPTGVSGLLASLAASVGYVRQAKTWKSPVCCSLGPEVPSQSAAFSSPLSTFFKNKFIYFIYLLFLAALGLRCCARAFSSCGERGYSSLQCAGFSLRWLLLLWSTGSRRTGFSSCGTWAQ